MQKQVRGRNESAPGKKDLTRASAMWALIGALLLGLLLRLIHIGDPAAGFHAFNEGFYTTAAAKDLARGASAWLTQPGDFNNPPFFTLVATTIFRITGVSLLVTRMISVVSGLATIVLAYLLGGAVYNRRTGVFASYFLAAMPGAVLINHNAQVDSLMVALATASIWVYVLAVKRKSNWLSLLGGALLGLAFITKLPAVLVLFALAIWEIWSAKNVKWLGAARTWSFVGGFALPGLPWHLVQFALHRAAYMGAQTGVGATFSLPSARFWSLLFFPELSWMHWPPFFIAMVVALAYLCWQRTSGDRLVITAIAVNLGFFLFYHFHTYYLLPIAPFTALAAARGTQALVDRWGRSMLIAAGLMVAGMVLGATVMMAGHKVGEFSATQIEPAIGSQAKGADLWAAWSYWANMGPTLDMYVRDMTVRDLPEGQPAPAAAEVTGGKKSFLMSSAFLADLKNQPIPYVALLTRQSNEVVIFGVGIGETPRNMHYMRNSAWHVDWNAYPRTTFGIKPVGAPETVAVLYDLDRLASAGSK